MKENDVLSREKNDTDFKNSHTGILEFKKSKHVIRGTQQHT